MLKIDLAKIINYCIGVIGQGMYRKYGDGVLGVGYVHVYRS